MSIHWTLNSIPELAPLTPTQRHELWFANLGKFFKNPVNLLVLIPFFGCVALGNYLGDMLIPWKHGIAIGGGLGAGLAVYLFQMVTFNRLRPHMHRDAEQRGWV